MSTMHFSKNINNVLHLADSALILAQRNSEWCAHGPILEQDIAITNITLDLIGQARNFYQYAASLINSTNQKNETEDTLAYLRTEREFLNLLICELPNVDWAHTVVRQFLFSSFQQQLFLALQENTDDAIQAIATKSIKETNYHVKWSAEWVIRLGDGTLESRERTLNAIEALWPYTGEFFTNEPTDMMDVSLLKKAWLDKITNVFLEASLSVPENIFMHSGGKKGVHTEHLGFILSEMQYLQRMYPGAQW